MIFKFKMTTVNVKVKDIRPLGYDNLRKWVEDENNVYIARKGIVFIDNQRFPKGDSIWCNPYKIGKDGTRDEVIAKYEWYIRENIKLHPSILNQLQQLKGKTLGCWCKPERCHGDVLIKLINEYNL